MAEELQGQAGGVPQGAGAGQPTAPAPGTAAPQAPATAAPAKARVNLDEFDEFRKVKSAYDKQFAEAKREADRARQEKAQAEQQLRDFQAQAVKANLRDADPEQIVKFYEERERQYAQRFEEQRRAQEQEAMQQQKATQVIQRAYEFLDSVGLKRDDPGLVWPESVNEEGLVEVMASAGRLLAAKKSATEAQTQQAVQQATVTALQESGAAHVSAATGSASPGLQAEFEERRKKLRHTGSLAEYAALKKEYRQKGLDI